MWEQRRLWELLWCKGLDLSNGNRLVTQRGQLPLSCSLSLSPLTPLSGRGGTGGGLKCKRGRGSETGGKWEEQRAEWERWSYASTGYRRSVCTCAAVRSPTRARVRSCLWADLKSHGVDYCWRGPSLSNHSTNPLQELSLMWTSRGK